MLKSWDSMLTLIRKCWDRLSFRKENFTVLLEQLVTNTFGKVVWNIVTFGGIFCVIGTGHGEASIHPCHFLIIKYPLLVAEIKCYFFYSTTVVQ